MARALALALLMCCAAQAAGARLSVCLYFDGQENGSDFLGGTRSAIMVRNLLGHFAEVDVLMTPVGRYSAGQLSGCDRAVYTGTYAEAKIPGPFLSDVARYDRPFLWMKYNIWRLEQAIGAEKFAAAWGFNYQSVDGKSAATGGGIPDFYRTVSYKGATFRKVAFVHPRLGLIADPEMVLVKNRSAKVLAEAIHSRTGASTPYVLRKGNFFYIADNPVAVIDERDRYLVLADLLFDVLQLAPRSDKRHAVLRIEDVHPGYDLRLLYQTIEALKRRKVSFAITLIPRYVGPEWREGLDLARDAKLLKLIRYAMANGATILAHGYEHRLTVDLGCGISYTGEGYEFWDVCRDRPLPFDSVQYVQERVDKAKKILDEAGIPYAGWVTPHYSASALAIRVIHGGFGRILQRMTYFVEGRPITPATTVDQFFPYPIFRDYYGIHVWPENLGYVPLPEHGGAARHIDEMLEAARVNLAVRDGWASFFWHPPLIRTELGIQSLEKLVDGIRALGYEFVSLQELRKRDE